MNTISREARQIELDESDYARHVFTVSTLDADGVHIDIEGEFTSNAKAVKFAKKLAHDHGLPLVICHTHPAFG
jgi:hypothetical protein